MQGIGSFPTDSEIMAHYVRVFEPGQSLMLAVFPALIMIRAIMNLIGQKGAGDYFLIIKDAFYGILLLISFISILKGFIELPQFFGSLFGDLSTFEIPATNQGYIAGILAWLAKWTTILVFHFTTFLFSILYLFAAGIAAYIIVLGIMFEAKWLVVVFFSILLICSAWPLFWYIINAMITQAPKDKWSTMFFVILGNAVKIALPFFTMGTVYKGSGAKFAKDSTKAGFFAMPFSKTATGFAKSKAKAGFGAGYTMGKSALGSGYSKSKEAAAWTKSKIWSPKDDRPEASTIDGASKEASASQVESKVSHDQTSVSQVSSQNKTSNTSDSKLLKANVQSTQASLSQSDVKNKASSVESASVTKIEKTAPKSIPASQNTAQTSETSKNFEKPQKQTIADRKKPQPESVNQV